MTYRLNVPVADGKYTVLVAADGRLKALRHQEKDSRDCVGDGLVLALAQEVEELQRNELQKLRGLALPAT